MKPERNKLWLDILVGVVQRVALLLAVGAVLYLLRDVQLGPDLLDLLDVLVSIR